MDPIFTTRREKSMTSPGKVMTSPLWALNRLSFLGLLYKMIFLQKVTIIHKILYILRDRDDFWWKTPESKKCENMVYVDIFWLCLLPTWYKNMSLGVKSPYIFEETFGSGVKG